MILLKLIIRIAQMEKTIKRAQTIEENAVAEENPRPILTIHL
jgi:hypothetical protein